jgi:hypothetical protein
MGEIAEMMLSGIMCEGCGVFFDDMDEPGHPRRCTGCRREERQGERPRSKPAPTPEQKASRAARRRRKRQRRREREAATRTPATCNPETNQ